MQYNTIREASRDIDALVVLYSDNNPFLPSPLVETAIPSVVNDKTDRMAR